MGPICPPPCSPLGGTQFVPRVCTPGGAKPAWVSPNLCTLRCFVPLADTCPVPAYSCHHAGADPASGHHCFQVCSAAPPHRCPCTDSKDANPGTFAGSCFACSCPRPFVPTRTYSPPAPTSSLPFPADEPLDFKHCDDLSVERIFELKSDAMRAPGAHRSGPVGYDWPTLPSRANAPRSVLVLPRERALPASVVAPLSRQVLHAATIANFAAAGLNVKPALILKLAVLAMKTAQLATQRLACAAARKLRRKQS